MEMSTIKRITKWKKGFTLYTSSNVAWFQSVKETTSLSLESHFSIFETNIWGSQNKFNYSYHINVSSDFHTKHEILYILWHVVEYLNFSCVSFKWWKKAVDVVGQKLNPVWTPSWFGIRSVVFENIEEALILKSKNCRNQFGHFWVLRYLPFSQM